MCESHLHWHTVAKEVRGQHAKISCVIYFGFHRSVLTQHHSSLSLSGSFFPRGCAFAVLWRSLHESSRLWYAAAMWHRPFPRRRVRMLPYGGAEGDRQRGAGGGQLGCMVGRRGGRVH